MIKEEFDLSEKLWYHLARRIVKAGGPPVPINNTLIELLKALINEEQLTFLLNFRKSLNLGQIKSKSQITSKKINHID